jgi:hypothetical protein
LGSQWFASRSQTSFMLAGQTTTVGNASSASIVASCLDGLAEPLLVGDEGCGRRSSA